MGNLAVLGTSSHVGKSLIVAGICRVLAREGVRVAPFKAQNMALNAYVTQQGEEIGFAQALQARAAGLEPTVDMNPILIKPEAENRAQLIVHGQVRGPLFAHEYRGQRNDLFQFITQSFQRLSDAYEVIILEGAGSPVELNLMSGDLANLRMARHAKAPILLVGDIDRGGIFAALYGSLALMPSADRSRVAGLLVNKFRGDPALFVEGRSMLEKVTGKPVMGIIPWRDFGLPEEDGVSLDQKASRFEHGRVRISVIRLPHISNFTDMAALEAEPGVSVAWQEHPAERPEAVIIPGTKSTIHDLRWLHAQGWDRAIAAWRDQGTRVVGICGGFQMLGEWVEDPGGLEGEARREAGLAFISATTCLKPEKQTMRRAGFVDAPGWPKVPVTGYEIHNGDTVIQGSFQAFLNMDGQASGYISSSGTVLGTYLHGIFDEAAFRHAFLAHCGATVFSGSDPVERGLQILEGVIREYVGASALAGLVGV